MKRCASIYPSFNSMHYGIRFIIDGGTSELPALHDVKSASTMYRTSVVPHHSIANIPVVGVNKLSLGGMFKQITQENSAFCCGPTNHFTGMDTDKQNFAARARMGIN